MAGQVRSLMLPRGCYVVHHALFSLSGAFGLLGWLSPTLTLFPFFGLGMSLGLLLSGSMGIYARFYNSTQMEITALRMMSILSVIWGSAVLYSVVSSRGATNFMGGLALIAQGALLWGLAQRIFRGYRAEIDQVQALIVLLMDDESEDGSGEESSA